MFSNLFSKRLINNFSKQSNNTIKLASPLLNTSSETYFSNTSVNLANAKLGPLDELVRDFLPPQDFHNLLKDNNINFFTGVPDSLLKDFCSYITSNVDPQQHVITANEGTAVALAAGHYLSTKKIPLVYMQNSGFGNAVNPLMSLTDPGVYSIPILCMVGWRGEPGKKDEPQHRVQGKIMPELLSSMNLAFEILPDYTEGAEQTIKTAVHYMKTRSAPFVILVKKQTFEPFKMLPPTSQFSNLELNREEFLEICLSSLDKWAAVVSTTGFCSREIFEIRERAGDDHSRDFLTVGSMGHASSIALGIAMGKPSRQVYVLDGDGAALMQMGAIGTAGMLQRKNFKHILMNNGVHDSVGAQPTSSELISFPDIAKACGYKVVLTANDKSSAIAALKKLAEVEGPAFLEVQIRSGARKDLGRPTSAPQDNKAEFMKFLNS